MAYATLAEVRAEGMTSVMASDARVTAALDLWTQFIERATRNFFELRSCTFDLDGTDSSTLFLPVPIVSLSQLFVNDDFANVVDPKHYEVYNSREKPRDDRWNPKIVLVRHGNIYAPPRTFWGPVFTRGRRNQRVIGTFGFTEPDGSTPLLIKRALLKLVIRGLLSEGTTGLVDAINNPRPVGGILSETTDGHSITYDAGQTKATRVGWSSITNDPEVDKILAMYKAPMAMAVPGSDQWYRG